MSPGEQNRHCLEIVKQRRVSGQGNATFNCEFGDKRERENGAPEHREQTTGTFPSYSASRMCLRQEIEVSCQPRGKIGNSHTPS